MNRIALLVAASLLLPAAAAGQRSQRTPLPNIPESMKPPAGKCRVWIEGVAPAQQPAPTDCQTALRQKPANGTVIFGPPVRPREPEAFQPQRSKSAPRRPPDSTSRRRPESVPRPEKAPSRDTTPPRSRSRRPDRPPPERP